MEKTLEQYMENATHYNSKNQNPIWVEMRRNRFIQYCKTHGLDKRFDRLLNNDPFWRAIAEVRHVYFFEEIISVYRVKGKKLPTIQLQCLEGWTTPVIKLVLPRNTTYFV